MLLVDENEVAAVNLTGASYTIAGGRWQSLEEGVLRSLKPGERTPTTRSTLASASVAPGRRLWVSTAKEVTVDSLEWTAVVGASA